MEQKNCKNTSEFSDEIAEEREADNESSQERKTNSSKILAVIRMIPKNILMLICQILIATILFVVSYINVLPSVATVILRIAAFVDCMLFILIRTVKKTFGGVYFSKDHLFVIISVAAAVIGKFMSSSASAIIFEAGGIFISSLHSKSSIALSNETGGILASDATPDHIMTSRINSISDDIKGGHFKAARKISSLESVFSFTVLAIAVLMCIIPPLFDNMSFVKWIYRALSVAAASTIFELGAIGMFLGLRGVNSAFSDGIYYKSVEAFFNSARITSVLFNKTGIITTGEFAVKDVVPVRINDSELLFLASYAEAFSKHPLAKQILNYSGIEPDKGRILRHIEQKGMGNIVQLSGSQLIAAGNIELMEKLGVKGDIPASGTTSVYISVNLIYVGRIDFADMVKSEAVEAIRGIRDVNVANVALMTGDNTQIATKVGREIGITEIYADHQPQDKIARIQYILSTQEPDDCLANVGDGIHDTTLLTLSNISIVLGLSRLSAGTNPDVLVNSTSLLKIPQIISIPQRVIHAVRSAASILILTNILLLILAMSGILGLWAVMLAEVILQTAISFVDYKETK